MDSKDPIWRYPGSGGAGSHERRGNGQLTFTGCTFYVLDPRPEDVCIEDIAHHLSLICRFGGATPTLYSVAQHSVIVSAILDTPEAPVDRVLWGLLHDAAEAYVGDMVWPMKRAPELAAFSAIEERVMHVIAQHFGLSWPEPREVKQADLIALATEKRDVRSPRRRRCVVCGVGIPGAHAAGCPEMASHMYFVGGAVEPTALRDMVRETDEAKSSGRLDPHAVVAPLPEVIVPWTAEVAEQTFLDRFGRLKLRR